jgi:hypothetical protein
MDDLNALSEAERAVLAGDLKSFPAPGVVYAASKLSMMLMLAKKSIERLQEEAVTLRGELKATDEELKSSTDYIRRTAVEPRGSMPTAKGIADELSTLLPQLDPRLLELIEAHVAPKHDDGAFSPALDAEILAERIRCARIVSDSVSPKRLELILSGEDIDKCAILPSGGISG